MMRMKVSAACNVVFPSSFTFNTWKCEFVLAFSSDQFSLVSQLCPTLCDPMD